MTPAAPRNAPWWSLRRVTSGGHYLPSVDGLRFVAILGVVLYHLSGQITTKGAGLAPGAHLGFVSWGGNGVRLFFVISGFVLALPYARARFGGRPPASVRAFYLRRLTRLEPPYFLNILLLFLLIPLASPGISYGELISHLLTHLTYTHNVYELSHQGMVSPVAWSLEVELQFYVLVPLIMGVFRARSSVTRALLVGGIALFSAFDLLVRPRYGGVEHFLPDQAQFFLTGVLISEVHTARQDRNLILWDVLAVIAAAAAVPLFARVEYGSFLVVPMGIALYAALASRHFSRVMAFGPFAILGGMCYTIYLWHFAVISSLWRVTSRFATPDFDRTLLVQALFVLPSIFLVSAGLFILVERPCMDRDWPAKAWRFLTHRRAPKDVRPVVSPDAPEVADEP